MEVVIRRMVVHEKAQLTSFDVVFLSDHSGTFALDCSQERDVFCPKVAQATNRCVPDDDLAVKGGQYGGVPLEVRQDHKALIRLRHIQKHALGFG